MTYVTIRRDVLEAIQHSAAQGRVPGNDWRREFCLIDAAVTAALAQPEAQPVAWWAPHEVFGVEVPSLKWVSGYKVVMGAKLYASPPAQAQPEAQPVKHATGWVAKRDQYAFPVLFNPYTGEPRDVRDVQSDPQGILIAHPNAHMLAASPPVQASEAQPHGYAYSYPDGLRFNHGQEVNGCRPTEAIPYWLGSPPGSPQMTNTQKAALQMLTRINEELGLYESPPVQAEQVIAAMRREIDDLKRRLREALPPSPEGLY